MKAIMISIRPQHAYKILNLIKLWEIRRKFPKDYVGWVYIYCTKDYHDRLYFNGSKYIILPRHALFDDICFNGKVVARFWVDKVDIIKPNEYDYFYPNNKDVNKSLEDLSCLTEEELNDYLCGHYGYAIHITKLEIFNKPKEISEFSHYDNSQYQALPNGEQYKGVLEPLTRAPQSWQFIEV